MTAHHNLPSENLHPAPTFSLPQSFFPVHDHSRPTSPVPATYDREKPLFTIRTSDPRPAADLLPPKFRQIIAPELK